MSMDLKFSASPKQWEWNHEHYVIV
jgi:hypothetical protein